MQFWTQRLNKYLPLRNATYTPIIRLMYSTNINIKHPVKNPNAFPKIYAPNRMNIVAGIQKGVEMMKASINKKMARKGLSFINST